MKIFGAVRRCSQYSHIERF